MVSSQGLPTPGVGGRSRQPIFVGKYQVDIASFEQIALPTLKKQQQNTLTPNIISSAPSDTMGSSICHSGVLGALRQSDVEPHAAKSEAVASVGVGGREQKLHSTTELQTMLPQTSQRGGLVVVDEIGKMELFSRSFVDSVRGLFEQQDNTVVLATIPMARRKSHWLIEELRHRPDCMLFEVGIHMYVYYMNYSVI